MSETITFFATLPQTRSAFIVEGADPPSAQLKLDIPANECHVFGDILRLGGKILVVSIHVHDDAVVRIQE